VNDLEQLIEGLCRAYPIDRRRIYLTGLSMGGFGAWELAARRPELFAAVVPICGGGNVDVADRLVHVPIWAVHGADDTIVKVQTTRRMIAAVRAAGGSPRYTELPGVGHDSWRWTYSDGSGVVAWMFEQVNERPQP
jgi:predicted peptidase